MPDVARELEELRKQLAQADEALVRALDDRARASRRLAELRRGAPSLPSNERAAIGAAARLATALSPEAVEPVLRAAHAATTPVDVVRAVVAGPAGGLAACAARAELGPLASVVAHDSAVAALDEVVRGHADLAFVPLESSADGPNHAAIAAIAATELSLVGRVALAASHRLVGASGDARAVRRVFATASDRAACARFLSTLEGAVAVDVPSPAAAAELAATDPDGAALVPDHGAPPAGLVVAASHVGDVADARVRFGIVAARPASRTGADATALVFGVRDQPGALFDVLRHFAERGVNLRSLQSRPVPGATWTYQFYAEVSGHVTDRALVTALDAVKREARTLRVLGSFPDT